MAATNPFEQVRLNAAGQEKSYQWYRQQVTNLGKLSTTNKVLKDTKIATRILPGEMYLFFYDPKYKDTLPYYDRMPLVLPFRVENDGFYGINLHYLPYLMRFNILGALSEYAIGDSSSPDTRIQLSWNLLMASSKLSQVKFAVKHYLNAHVRSSLYKIDYTDWVTASQLPVEKFVGAQKNKVWQDFRRTV